MAKNPQQESPNAGTDGRQPSWDLVLYRLDEITGGQALMNDKIDNFGSAFVPRSELNDWRMGSQEEHKAIRAEIEQYKKEVNGRFSNYTWVIRTLFVIVAGIVIDALVRIISQVISKG